MSTINNNSKKYLNEEQAAGMLCLSVRTLQQWRWRRVGPEFTKLSSSTRGKGHILYDYDDIVAFIDAHRVKTIMEVR